MGDRYIFANGVIKDADEMETIPLPDDVAEKFLQELADILALRGDKGDSFASGA